jgi:hypothetical protein
MTVDPKTISDRLKICGQCSYWLGGCTRGHYVTSPQGCPLKKFPPLRNFGYAADRPVVKLEGCCGEG